MLVGFGTELELLGKREAQLSNCYSQIALKVNLSWGGRIFLINYLCAGPSLLGGTTPLQVDMGAMKSKLS